MKSKQIKWIAAGIILLATVGWAWWQLIPKTKDTNTQKEINIQPAELPKVETATYNDWSGFKFDYPNILTVKEVELDNPQVYSSLEISGADGKRLTVRVSDTQTANLIDWQKSFNQQNSVRKIDQASLANLPGLKLQFGAPEMFLTVAIDNGIIYEVQSTADDGFWDRTHNDLVASWQFSNPGETSQNDAVTLVEETVE